VCEAGLADARLARQQHHLPFPVFGLLKSVEQHAEFVLASDQRCEAEHAASCRKSALGAAVAQHAPSLNAIGEAPQLALFQIE
jgi:hypothetical protein